MFTSLQVPSNLSIDQAASIPLTLCTAAFGLYAPKGPRGGAALFPPWEAGGRGKYAGKPILIFGGSSSVGQYGELHNLTTPTVYSRAYIQLSSSQNSLASHPLSPLHLPAMQHTSNPSAQLTLSTAMSPSHRCQTR